MGKRKDEYARFRIREILEESIRLDEKLRWEQARNPNPNPWVRESIIGTPKEPLIHATFAVVSAAIIGAIIAWLAGVIFDLSDLRRERVFWIVVVLGGATNAATIMRGAMADRAIDWARQEEAASDNARSLKRMLEDIDSELEGAVPDLDRYDNSDLYGESPVIDAALKGLRLPDRSRPAVERGSPLARAEKTPVAKRKEPTIIR